MLNRDFIRITRVVIHPKFRSIGLGAKIVKETLPLVGKKHIETIAVMAKYPPFITSPSKIGGQSRVAFLWGMARPGNKP